MNAAPDSAPQRGASAEVAQDSTGRVLGPRLVVAGTHSGVGKTTVATGLLAALRRAGHTSAGAKVGPDFIDPGYHALASGRPPRNLDPWICGPEAIGPLAARAGEGTDILIVEGVMGLFDGAVDGGPSSTADVAKLLDAPIVLVVDAAAMSGSVAALVSGYAGFDPDVRVAGVVLNRVGSDGHETLLREALEPLRIPVLGALRRDDRLVWRDRHLGLVPVAERAGEVTDALALLASAVAEQVDLAAVAQLAAAAPPRQVDGVRIPTRLVPPGQPAVPVAVAAGEAFTFTYADTLDALRVAGMDPVPFDPVRDEALPPGAAGLIAGGGFPEVYVDTLAANTALLTEVRHAAADGLPIWAECGGLLWLCQSLDGVRMAGVIPAEGYMQERLTLGYREAAALRPNPAVPVGEKLRGHEFHYSKVEPSGDALELRSRWGTRPEGFAATNLLATYLHVHPGGDPTPVERFAHACAHRATRHGQHM